MWGNLSPETKQRLFSALIAFVTAVLTALAYQLGAAPLVSRLLLR